MIQYVRWRQNLVLLTNTYSPYDHWSFCSGCRLWKNIDMVFCDICNQRLRHSRVVGKGKRDMKRY